MPAKKMDSADIEVLDRIAQKYAAFAASRSTIEHEIRREAQARLEAQEALIAADVLSAMRRPGITNSSLMRTIGKQNPDRWKAWLAKWETMIPQEMTDAAEAELPDPVIAYELPLSDPERRVAGLSKIFGGDGPNLRMFKLRTVKYPHDIRLKFAGVDVVIYNMDEPESEAKYFDAQISNPGWGNTPNGPFGPDREKVLMAIKAWIEKHPEAPE
jgi:hypothetical protein